MKEKRLRSLISLLDDDDSNVVSAAMYELLAEDPESARINQLMAELQETPGIRRRIHQLQVIQTNCPGINIFFIVKTLLDDDMHQSVNPGDI